MAAVGPAGAAPAALAAAPPAAQFAHAGNPDLSIAADVIALGNDPPVLLLDRSHSLRKAVPDADWTAAPVDAVSGISPGWFIPQSTLDMWAIAAGRVTSYLRKVPNLLGLHVRPDFFSEMVTVLVLVGRLSLTHTYKDEEWLKELARAGDECGNDPRVLLEAAAFYAAQTRAAGAAAIAGHNYMYLIGGDLVFTDNDSDTFAAAYIMKGTAPRTLRAGRDAARDPYCRFFTALQSISSGRSEYFKDALADASTPEDEIAEYVINTWVLLIKTGYHFSFGPRFSQRGMELEVASRMAFGTSAQKEIAFTELFPARLDRYKRVKLCVDSGGGSQDWGKTLEAFSHLAELYFPGSVWANFTMVSTVERELAKIAHVVESWGQCSTVERLATVRDCVIQAKQVMGLRSGNGGTINESGCSIAGTSGLEATRAKEFLDTKAEIAGIGAEDFVAAFDATNSSHSKLWRMVGYGKVAASAHVHIREIEAMSKFVPLWNKYWPMALVSASSGKITKAVQGKVFSDMDVSNLLNGLWAKIDWVFLSQQLDLWSDNLQPEPTCTITDELQGFSALCMARSTLSKTMIMLQVAVRADESEYSVQSFIDRVIKLEKRSRALPKGSAQRGAARANYEEAYYEGLKECGERWANQWRKPTDYAAPMHTNFSSGTCFYNNTLDHLEKVADQLYDLKDTLVMSHENSNRSKEKVHFKDEGAVVALEVVESWWWAELVPWLPHDGLIARITPSGVYLPVGTEWHGLGVGLCWLLAVSL